jgi:hypothetical protein
MRTKKVTITLTPSEQQKAREASEFVFGKPNLSGFIAKLINEWKRSASRGLRENRCFTDGDFVKVLHCFHGHEFEIGEVVCIVDRLNYSGMWLCRNEKGVEWYLNETECEVVIERNAYPCDTN